MKKYISKKYNTLKQAENYQNRLYTKYNRVELISYPMFCEYGVYTWLDKYFFKSIIK